MREQDYVLVPILFFSFSFSETGFLSVSLSTWQRQLLAGGVRFDSQFEGTAYRRGSRDGGNL